MIEDTREPKWSDHSACDDCGCVFDNDDLNELPGDEWLCDDCLENRNDEDQEQ